MKSDNAIRLHTNLLRAFCALAAMAVAYVFYVEIRGRRGLPLNIDELFFAMCAERARLADGGLATGCHDNKVPGIYYLYQWVLGKGSSFDLLPLKLTSIALVLSAAALSKAITARLGASAGGQWLAVGLVLWAFAYTPGLAAVKPDLVGSVLTLFAIWLRLAAGRTGLLKRLLLLLAVGLVLGTAVSVKQSFVFGACAFIAAEIVGSWRNWRELLPNLMAVGAGLLLMPLALAGWFVVQGVALEALGSAVIYPALYGDVTESGGLAKLMNRAYGMTALFDPYGLPVYVAFLLLIIGRQDAVKDRSLSQPPGQSLLLICMWAYIFFLLIAPVRSSAYALPVTLLVSIFSGQRWSMLERGQSLNRGAAASGCAALLLFAAQGLIVTWGGESGNPLRERYRFPTFELEDPPKFAYVAGTWPKLYWDNRMLPASSVMYPNAFGKLPSLWRFKEPTPDSWMGQQLARLRQRNLERLAADFARTPPGLIVVVDGETRATDSQRAVDIPFLDEYIRLHCHFDRRLDQAPKVLAAAYRCGL